MKIKLYFSGVYRQNQLRFGDFREVTQQQQRYSNFEIRSFSISYSLRLIAHYMR